MKWLRTILVGLVAEATAKAFMRGGSPCGMVVTTLLGIIGSVIGALTLLWS